jgi:hypothetical protein
VGDAGVECEHVAVRQRQSKIGLFTDGQERIGPDVEAARGQIFGFGFDRSGRPIEFHPTATDEPLIATASRVAHYRKSIGPGICCLVYTG